ncbi:MAG TPA: winged helix-turn-helix domain-containing protein [Kineosporiaceae bacterium]
MHALTARPRSPETPSVDAATAPPGWVTAEVTGVPGSPAGRTEVRLVGPDAVPEGAVVVGLVVALPAPAAVGAPGGSLARHLAAVTLSASGGARTSSVPSPVATPSAAPTASPVPTADPSGHPQGGPGVVVDRWGRQVLVDGAAVAVTRREFELLDHLVAHPGRVFTRSQLLAAVWDLPDPRYAPARTVDVHVSRLRRKLGAAHADCLQSLRGVGYRWAARPSPTGERP